ncbi:MAG TPA: hypothetical protein VN900_17275 [Stellaceae bacterium]|nr:hypothetical protein [Stellaceae bacterium]
MALAVCCTVSANDRTYAQTPPSTTASPRSDSILLTIFLRHDQSKTLDEINDHLKKTGWYDKFPPQGVEIVSWYVMMGVGQVVTLRVPADKLREVNRIIEESAWGGYRTEFYPTYDYKPVWEAMPGHHP